MGCVLWHLVFECDEGREREEKVVEDGGVDDEI